MNKRGLDKNQVFGILIVIAVLIIIGVFYYYNNSDVRISPEIVHYCVSDSDCESLPPLGALCSEWVCSNGVCSVNSICPTGWDCLFGLCVSPECGNPGNPPCPNGQICYGNSCNQNCLSNSDCLVGYECDDGICKWQCEESIPCPDGLECLSGVCKVICGVNEDCPNGHDCVSGVCKRKCGSSVCGSISGCANQLIGSSCSIIEFDRYQDGYPWPITGSCKITSTETCKDGTTSCGCVPNKRPALAGITEEEVTPIIQA